MTASQPSETVPGGAFQQRGCVIAPTPISWFAAADSHSRAPETPRDGYIQGDGYQEPGNGVSPGKSQAYKRKLVSRREAREAPVSLCGNRQNPLRDPVRFFLAAFRGGLRRISSEAVKA